MNKPPLGIIPKHFHRAIRAKELSEAIVRYFDAGMQINLGWVQEYNELIEENKFVLKRSE